MGVPSNTERETLADLLDEQFTNWQWDSLAHGLSAGQYVAQTVLEAGFRLPSPVTEKEVDAAARSNYQFQNRMSVHFVPAWTDIPEDDLFKGAYREEARAALEAARTVREANK